MKIAIVLIFFAAFFWLVNFKVLCVSRDWPIILIFLGVNNILFSSKYSRKKIIEDLEKGKITPDEALKKLEKLS
ncbi:MAG: SHOCT-like domain-containing protein [bacterium]